MVSSGSRIENKENINDEKKMRLLNRTSSINVKRLVGQNRSFSFKALDGLAPAAAASFSSSLLLSNKRNRESKSSLSLSTQEQKAEDENRRKNKKTLVFRRLASLGNLNRGAYQRSRRGGSKRPLICSYENDQLSLGHILQLTIDQFSNSYKKITANQLIERAFRRANDNTATTTSNNKKYRTAKTATTTTTNQYELDLESEIRLLDGLLKLLKAHCLGGGCISLGQKSSSSLPQSTQQHSRNKLNRVQPVPDVSTSDTEQNDNDFEQKGIEIARALFYSTSSSASLSTSSSSSPTSKLIIAEICSRIFVSHRKIALFMAAAEENKTPNEKQKKQQESSMLSNAKLLLAQMRPKRMIVLSNLRLFMYASRWLDNLKVLKQQDSSTADHVIFGIVHISNRTSQRVAVYNSQLITSVCAQTSTDLTLINSNSGNNNHLFTYDLETGEEFDLAEIDIQIEIYAFEPNAASTGCSSHTLTSALSTSNTTNFCEIGRNSNINWLGLRRRREPERTAKEQEQIMRTTQMGKLFDKFLSSSINNYYNKNNNNNHRSFSLSLVALASLNGLDAKSSSCSNSSSRPLKLTVDDDFNRKNNGSSHLLYDFFSCSLYICDQTQKEAEQEQYDQYKNEEEVRERLIL